MNTRPRTEWQKLVDDRLKDHDKRLTDQEKTSAVYQAVSEEQRKYINDRFNRVQDNITQTKTDLTAELSGAKSAINKVLLAVITAIILGFVQFMIRGGISP